MDASWKGKGPPLSEQDRSGHNRARILAAYLDPDGSKSPAKPRKLTEGANKTADEVAARAEAAAARRANEPDGD